MKKRRKKNKDVEAAEKNEREELFYMELKMSSVINEIMSIVNDSM